MTAKRAPAKRPKSRQQPAKRPATHQPLVVRARKVATGFITRQAPVERLFRQAADKLATARHGGTWRRIEIQNYRSIEHASIELPPFTVIVGPTGSGKTNFVDALVFARDVANDAAAAVEQRGGIASVRRRGPRPTDIMIDLRVSSSKGGLDSDYVRHSFTIKSDAKGQFALAEELIEIVSKGLRRWIGRKGGALNLRGVYQINKHFFSGLFPKTTSAMLLAGALLGLGQASALRTVRRCRLNPDEMRQPRLASDKVRLEENGANIAVAVRAVREAGRLDDLLRAMAKIVPGLRDVKVQQVDPFLTLRFAQEQDRGLIADFTAMEMSDGALRALGIIVATLQVGPDELLIIEEPEASIHMGAAAMLCEVLKEASEAGAVLITTHSAALLDAARDEEILVCESAKGVTSIGPLAAEQRQVVHEGLSSVAELMRSEPLRIDRRAASPG